MQSAEIIFTNCKRKNAEGLPPEISSGERPVICGGRSRVTSIKLLGVTMTNNLSVGEHGRDVISKCAQSLHALKLLRHHGMSDDSLRLVYKSIVLSKLLYASPAWWPGGVLPARPISNVSKHLYDVLSGTPCTSPTNPRHLNWLLTWTTTSSRIYSTTLTMFCTYFSRTKLIILTILDLVVILCH